MPRRETIIYRNIFIDGHGDLPHPCAVCGEIVERWGKYREDGTIHHIDGDWTNNRLDNLEVVHMKCHVGLHWDETLGEYSRAPKSEEVRAKISASLTGRTDSDEVRRNKSKAAKASYASGRKSAGGRAKGSTDEPVPCSFCPQMVKPANLARHERGHDGDPCDICGVPYTPYMMKRHRYNGWCVIPEL